MWFFLALLALAAAERRVADIDVGALRIAPTFERWELEGDDIRDRLKALNDEKIPVAPEARDVVAVGTLQSLEPDVESRALAPSPPRGPPMAASSTA